MKKLLNNLILIPLFFSLSACIPINLDKTTDTHPIYSKALKTVGTELMHVSNDTNTKKPMRSASSVPYPFVGMLVYWSGLLYQHDYYDSSERIVKFCGHVHQGEAVREIGFQTNIHMDVETGFITFYCSQGENADHYCAMVIMEAKYDIENDLFGDFYIGTTTLDENHNPVRNSIVSERKDGVIISLNNNDEETFNVFKEKLKPYVDKINDAYLEEDEDKVNSYCVDYEAAGDYYNNVAGQS